MYMKINILGYILLGLTILICLRIYQESDLFNLKCIISDVDGKRYCVRERRKLELAANLLAKVNVNLQKLVNSVKEKYPDRSNVQRLVAGYNPKKIVETLPTSIHTAYSQNKGEKLAFCLDVERKGISKLIDLNTLTFVAIHEIAHIATESVGHTEEYWDNFKFLLKEASDINIYKPVDYKNKPKKYCGMNITDNPLFDH